MFRLIASAMAAIMIFASSGIPAAMAAERLEIRVLSSPRPDLVSGGDALVEVIGAGTASVSLKVNGIAGAVLRYDAARNSQTGLVTGLREGRNVLTVRAGRRSAQLTLVNHSRNGPILSGPHILPYECRTEESGMGPALDAMCNAARRIDWFYRSTAGSFKPLPPGNLPADIASTTTSDGVTMPYIVRVESGTLNRTIYRIAMLGDPAPRKPADAREVAWNGRLAVSFGGGGGAKYHQGVIPPEAALEDRFLARGFAHVVASELVNDLHGNAVLQGEALMMIKEHFIETYGVPRWTVGSGGSGGAIQQYVIAQIYPGLLDGLLPEIAFPDSSPTIADCGLLESYWQKADTKVWTEAKRTAVTGFAPLTCKLWNMLFVPVTKAAHKPGCALKDQSLVYDARTNPRGARCSVVDWRVNQLGRDPKTGFAYGYDDNVGVQYGLGALNSGAIDAEEFLDLNERVGGTDADGNPRPERTRAQLPGLERSYASGLVNSGGGGLAYTPILSLRGYSDPSGDIHDRFRDIVVRERLRKANGNSDNAAFWVAPPDPKRLPAIRSLALDTMTLWLDRIAAAPGPVTPARIVRLKPEAATDAYFDAEGGRHPEPMTLAGPGEANRLYPFHSDPRVVAGGPLSMDVLKCRLKPPARGDYRVAFTADQWARLGRIFPDGVCDYSKKGVGQVPLKGIYQRY